MTNQNDKNSRHFVIRAFYFSLSQISSGLTEHATSCLPEARCFPFTVCVYIRRQEDEDTRRWVSRVRHQKYFSFRGLNKPRGVFPFGYIFSRCYNQFYFWFWWRILMIGDLFMFWYFNYFKFSFGDLLLAERVGISVSSNKFYGKMIINKAARWFSRGRVYLG